MSYIYILSSVILISLFVLYKKNDKKLDIFTHLGLFIVLYLCYNTFICYVFSNIRIPINLISLSIINYAISAILLAVILKTKKIQKYKLNKIDIIAFIIIIAVTGIVSYFDFGNSFNIKYLTTDSSIHYLAAREFYENDTLLLNVANDIESSGNMMPGAYTNTGILFKTFAPIIGETNLYKIFISFDIFMLILAGMMMYISIKKFNENKYVNILAIIVSVLYMLGYPLNNMLSGYCYLGLGIIIINTIFIYIRRK